MRDNYDKPRSYYANKKQKFQNKSTCNGFNKNGNTYIINGDTYGWETLKNPYSEEEILNYELKYNIKIPINLRNYLINISRETIGSYPYTITLDEPMVYYFYMDSLSNSYDCSQDTGGRYCDHTKGCISMNDKETSEQLPEKELINRGFNPIYYIKTHENGCSEDDFLCVKGKYFGKTCNTPDGGSYFAVDEYS